MPVEVGTAYVDIKPDMSGFGRDLKTGMSRDVERAGKAAGPGIKGAMIGVGQNMAAGMLAGFGAAAIGGFLKSSVDAASSLNEVASKSRTVFGASADAMEQWAEGGAEAFGLSKRAALDAAGGFGNMFSQLGIGQQQAAGMSRSIVELAADFASFHNANIEDVIVAQSAAFRGEYDSIQRFLPLLNAASVEQKALEMTGKKATRSLTAQDKALAVNALMFDGAGEAAGDFARTQESLANQTRSAGAAFENAKAALGEGLMPMMTTFVSWLTTTALPTFTTLFGIGDEKPKAGWASGFQNLIRDAAGFVVDEAELIGNALNIDTSGLAHMSDELHRSVGEIWELNNAGKNNNAMLDDMSRYLAASTSELGPHTGALQLDSKAIAAREKATKDAARADRDLARAQKDYATLLREGAVDEEAVLDARESLADATRDAARADRELNKARREYDEAAAIAGILGTDTALESMADAADTVTDAEESAADAHRRAAEAAKELREAQAGDPDFQDKLADAKDRVASAQDKVNEAMTKLVELAPAINTALDGVYNRLDAIGIKGIPAAATLATLTGYESYKNMSAPVVGSPVIPPAAPAGLLGSNPLGPAGATNNVTVNVTEPRADPVHIAREMVWSLT